MEISLLISVRFCQDLWYLGRFILFIVCNYSGRFLTGWTGWTGFGQGGSRASAADATRLRRVEGWNEGVAVEEAAQSIHRADRIFPGC